MGYPYLYFCLCAFLLDTAASDPNLVQVPTEVVNGILDAGIRLDQYHKDGCRAPRTLIFNSLDEHQASATSAPVA